MSMRIDIEERVFHFKQPATTSRGAYTERRSWLVTIDNGLTRGVGECAPLPGLSCDDLPPQVYAEKLRDFCDTLQRTEHLSDELRDALRDYPSMLFGLETALSNLNYQPLEAPQAIPINGLVWMGSYDEMLQRLEEKLRQGFRCVKLKVGAIDFQQELELVKRVRQRFSPHELQLRLDANGGFAPDEALYQLELLSQYGIHSIEQPIKQKQWAMMAELCREAPLPIALDEELIGINEPDAKRQMLRIVKPAYIVLKPSLHGGMSGCREWIETAREEGIGSWVTSALESNIGLHAIARFCLSVYGPDIKMPQGLGTGQLFTDNIPMPIEMRGDRLWVTQ